MIVTFGDGIVWKDQPLRAVLYDGFPWLAACGKALLIFLS
jgi:hypothetical protein